MNAHWPVSEAARYLGDPLLSKEYRRECLKLWRQEYGEYWTSQVEKLVLAKWKKKS